jgi:hypothetical protein
LREALGLLVTLAAMPLRSSGHPRLYFTRVHPMRRALMCLGRETGLRLSHAGALIRARLPASPPPSTSARLGQPALARSAHLVTRAVSVQHRQAVSIFGQMNLHPYEAQLLSTHPSIALRFMKDDWSRALDFGHRQSCRDPEKYSPRCAMNDALDCSSMTLWRTATRVCRSGLFINSTPCGRRCAASGLLLADGRR